MELGSSFRHTRGRQEWTTAERVKKVKGALKKACPKLEAKQIASMREGDDLVYVDFNENPYVNRSPLDEQASTRLTAARSTSRRVGTQCDRLASPSPSSSSSARPPLIWQALNVTVYPRAASVRVYEAATWPGDIIFIPTRWWRAAPAPSSSSSSSPPPPPPPPLASSSFFASVVASSSFDPASLIWQVAPRLGPVREQGSLRGGRRQRRVCAQPCGDDRGGADDVAAAGHAARPAELRARAHLFAGHGPLGALAPRGCQAARAP